MQKSCKSGTLQLAQLNLCFQLPVQKQLNDAVEVPSSTSKSTSLRPVDATKNIPKRQRGGMIDGVSGLHETKAVPRTVTAAKLPVNFKWFNQ